MDRRFRRNLSRTLSRHRVLCNPVFIAPPPKEDVPEEPGVVAHDGVLLYWMTLFFSMFYVPFFILALHRGPGKAKIRLSIEGALAVLFVTLYWVGFIAGIVKQSTELWIAAVVVSWAVNIYIIVHLFRQSYGRIYNYAHTVHYRAAAWKKIVSIVLLCLNAFGLLMTGILVAVVYPKFSAFVDKAKAAAALPIFYDWQDAQDAYFAEHGQYGTQEQIGFIYSSDLMFEIKSTGGDEKSPKAASLSLKLLQPVSDCPANTVLVWGKNANLSESGEVLEFCGIGMVNSERTDFVAMDPEVRHSCEMAFSGFLTYCANKDATYGDLATDETYSNPMATPSQNQ